jgi:lipopolysaccharide biosynthesis glycosyltransferase
MILHSKRFPLFTSLNNNVNFINSAMKLLTSVKKHDSKLFSKHIVLHTDLTKENQKILKDWGWDLFKMPDVDPILVNKSKERFTSAAWLRMYIADHFDDASAFYIDADAFLVKSISKISALPKECQNKSIAVAYNSSHGDEFNSGVMFFNLTRWRSKNLTRTLTKRAINSKHGFLRADQDVLNMIPVSERLHLPSSYNFTPMCPYHFDQYRRNYPRILHFRNWHPWQKEQGLPGQKINNPWRMHMQYIKIWKNIEPVSK